MRLRLLVVTFFTVFNSLGQEDSSYKLYLDSSKSHIDRLNDLDKGIKDLSNLIDWAHENDLDFHVTELDYFVEDKSNLNNDLLKQKIIYSRIINLLEEKSKNGLVTLNFWDMGERYKKGKGYFQSIYSKELKPNPSYELLNNILK